MGFGMWRSGLIGAGDPAGTDRAVDWVSGWRELADMIWPRKCVVCGELLEVHERHVCSSCMTDMPMTYFWSWRNNPAEQILWGRTFLEGVVSLFYYSRDNDYRRLLYALKYKGDMALGRWLGRLLGGKMREAAYPLPDVIIPVPLHWKRKWKRGYNQAEVIAHGVSEGLSGHPSCRTSRAAAGSRIPVSTDILGRVRYSASQTGMSVGSKWENVSGAFALKDIKTAAGILSGRHVLLVDDVLTTGATVEACWDALRVIPGIRVSYASIAFVSRPG